MTFPRVSTWIKHQFSDVEHARRAVLTFAVCIGTLGFLVIIGTVVYSWLGR